MHAQSDGIETERHASAEIGIGPAAAGTYVTFDLSGQSLGVEVCHVREILDTVAISRLPNAPHEIEGVIDIRGESIPIVDMGSRLGLPRMEDGEDTRIIVFELRQGDQVRAVGVLADRVRDVTQIPAAEIEVPPEVIGATWEAELLRGFARHAGLLILLLNIERIFGTDAESMTLDPNYF